MGRPTSSGPTERIKPRIMINSPLGKMGSEIARAIAKSDEFRLYPLAFIGENKKEDCLIINGQQIMLYTPEERRFLLEEVQMIGEPDLVVDYTLPKAAMVNAQLYCAQRWPFVMGTTGIDAISLEKMVKETGIRSVVHKNMGEQIVAFQREFKEFVDANPNSLMGYLVAIIESHQLGKIDTSGTAKDMVDYLNALGIPYLKEGMEVRSMDDITSITTQKKIAMIRNPQLQKKIGVPEEHLKRHGWHTYEFFPDEGTSPDLITPLTQKLQKFVEESPVFEDYRLILRSSDTLIERISPDNKVVFSLFYDKKGRMTFTHNVNGANIYLDGTFNAARYILGKEAEAGKVSSMIDVINRIKK